MRVKLCRTATAMLSHRWLFDLQYKMWWTNQEGDRLLLSQIMYHRGFTSELVGLSDEPEGLFTAEEFPYLGERIAPVGGYQQLLLMPYDGNDITDYLKIHGFTLVSHFNQRHFTRMRLAVLTLRA